MYLRPMIRYLLSGLLLCLIFSCEDPELVGSAVLPSGDQPGVFFTDTTTIKGQTVKEDSLVGSNNTAPLFLGSMNDAEIGVSAASFYVQLRLGSLLNNGFNGVTKPDSVVLSLGYKSIYGDSAAMHHISVYEMDESMSVSSIYYTTHDFALKSPGIGSVSLVPNLVDSIQVGTTKKPAQLRFRLSDDVGTSIMQQYITDSTTYSSNSKFLEFFKGIYLTDIADGNGSILTLDPNSSLNALTIYYKKAPTDPFSSVYNFLINENSARNNRYKHQYNPTVFDSVNPTTFYVQSMAGLKTKLQFPNLMNLTANHPVSINNATIVVKIKPGSTTPLTNHLSLIVRAADSLGRNTLIIDEFESNNVINGLFTNDICTLNISRYLQSVVNGDLKNYGIYLVASGSLSNARRTFLEGPVEVKLNLTYTHPNN